MVDSRLAVPVTLALAAFGVALHRPPSTGPFIGAARQVGQSAAVPLILQEGDGERRIRPTRPGGAGSSSEFFIKVDEQNGNAEDFFVVTEVMRPGGTIPFHKHHNSEELVILEEGSATVTVGDRRAVTGPHAIVFIPRDTWVSITNTGVTPIHMYGIFSRQGFESYMRARSVRPGEPATPLTADEARRAAEAGHVTYWDPSQGPFPPGVAHP